MSTSYRARFEQLVDELKARPELLVREARIGPPTSADTIRAARTIAGAAWPDTMDELYREVSSVDIEWNHRDGGSSLSGGIHIPEVAGVWDYDALEGELWFDFVPKGTPLHHIRPIDRFCPEAYAVLHPVPSKAMPSVHYHYCGESLIDTGLSYRAWLDRLFVARGVSYWLGIFTGPRASRTWVEEAHDEFARLFPDFDPIGWAPRTARAEIDLY